MADLEGRNAQHLISKRHPAGLALQDDSSRSNGGNMDVFSQVIHEFAALPSVSSWDEARNLFEQATSRKPDHWLIPARACASVGGSPQQALLAILAIGCAHVGILLVDDMLDEDPRGDYRRLGMPAASNLACFFQAVTLQAVSQCTQDLTSRSIALTSFNHMFLLTAFGQFLDVQAPVTEDGYWKVARTKSSPFFGAALQLGALAGGSSPEIAERLKELGCLYGEMIQIHDDMHDSMETPANPDWVQGRSPLPILFASLVKHPEQSRFQKLRGQIDQPEALKEAQEILIRCGAISYCANELIQKYEEARKILGSIPLVNHEPLSSLFEEVITPVFKLLEASEVES
jgi:geranylgeranyl pyrophosphate synthase